MTYAELAQWIQTLTPEQLQQDATVFDDDNGEYHPVTFADIAVASGIMDDGHPVIGF